MRNILNEITEKARERVAAAKKETPLSQIRDEAERYPLDFKQASLPFPFEEKLRKRGNDISFICEIKKASPSKGIIDEKFDYIGIAREYEEAGADCISVLTEPYYFYGSNSYLREISRKINLPVLRKDFIVDEYMIYEAKTLGAEAVLLITAILDEKMISEYVRLAASLGMSALVETRSEAEIETALRAEARIIGVNCRNLETFEVDVGTSARLRKYVPRDILFVSESGVSTPSDIKKLREANVNAVLIGEALMKSRDKKSFINSLINGGE